MCKDPASHMKNIMYQVNSNCEIMDVFAISLLLLFFSCNEQCITLVIRKKLLIKKFKICINFPLTFSQLQLEHTGREKGTCSFAIELFIFLCKKPLSNIP